MQIQRYHLKINKRGNVWVKLLLLSLLFSSQIYAQQINLAGEWRFALDREDKGTREKWFEKALPNETVKLPGSLAENNKGDEVDLYTKWTGTIYDSSYYHRPTLARYREPGNVKIPFWLSPVKYYVGVAWYQKTINLPEGWGQKQVSLFLERCHIQTAVWLDGKLLGTENSLVAPHTYLLPKGLKPGNHVLTIRVDNRIDKMNVGPDSHSVSDHTQGNWNGIVGKIVLEAKPLVHITNVQVYPDVQGKKARVVLQFVNGTAKQVKGTIMLSAESFNTTKKHKIDTSKLQFKAVAADTTVVEAELVLGNGMQLWDEFNPALYRLTATLDTGKGKDEQQVTFGMRDVKVQGRFITLNGNKIHLRGDLNNCEFPLTGYPPTDVEGWKQVYAAAKAHGLNHFRFHSWCPPEAAFTAADEVGFYLQPEGPTWPNHGTTLGDGAFIDKYLYEETARIMQSYGNHPSFCLFASGNEPAGKNQATYLEAYNAYWKSKDSRHLYTGASVAMSWPLYPGSDYMIKSGPRGLNWHNQRPETMTDYNDKISQFDIPYITHEMGQWCVFPDFKEIKEYTGVMRARNFELFEADLQAHGMGNLAQEFLMASGKLQALCYKQEIEKSLRTANSAGFQLLGLQDFPGQGSAIIGVLNAFWKEKGYISPEEWSRFCNSTVLLSRIPKFTYTSNEAFTATIEAYHYGPADYKDTAVKWTLKNDGGTIIAQGSLNTPAISRGGVSTIGTVSTPLNTVTSAQRLTLEVSLEGTSITNNWSIWVYPAQLPDVKTDVYFTDVLDAKAEAVLKKGGTVFLNAAGKVLKGKEVEQYFTPVFWNTSWFKMKPPHTLGILADTASAAFKDFPTSYHSDLQWWEIVNRAQVMNLEDFPQGFRPLVQPIDTWFMNRKLALLFEARCGNGKIIVCSANLFTNNKEDVVSRQLLYSLKRYMASAEFNPKESVDIALIKKLFTEPSKEVWDSFTKENPDELKPLPAVKD
ncbi:beta-glucuronidase [Flavobacterium akiainvivens]|uniref:beta-galactosidase n=1 Tax=Flavobacterium akiainvivens TaxID=1202724 RepID=A0A0M8M8A2_9FLAO|nr:sugar-binding domain-containing protein [Flavobacterium akiainvivens]KOS05583.1 beta-glucuronidase [Flavobacterium akiainvivens]SFQ34774.1 Glycosyl hydrolases family 2 [Flavobacterium akiainvivens]